MSATTSASCCSRSRRCCMSHACPEQTHAQERWCMNVSIGFEGTAWPASTSLAAGAVAVRSKEPRIQRRAEAAVASHTVPQGFPGSAGRRLVDSASTVNRHATPGRTQAVWKHTVSAQTGSRVWRKRKEWRQAESGGSWVGKAAATVLPKRTPKHTAGTASLSLP